jgi:threonine aldolase
MRQAGIMAAAALYALEHHVVRLKEDQHNAHLLADAIADLPHLLVVPGGDDAPLRTNLLFIEVDPHWGTAEKLCTTLREHGVLTLALSHNRIRAVTHLGVTREQVEQVGQLLRQTA